MPKVFPFSSMRPLPEMAAGISARIHGNESLTAQVEYVKNHPNSYLSVIKPQLYFAEKKKDPSKHYDYAKQHLEELKENGFIVHDDEDSVFVYGQKYPDGYSCLGIVAALLSEDYDNNNIRKHENTRKKKEEQVMKHIKATNAIGEPVLVSCSASFELHKALAEQTKKNFDYEFQTDDGVIHTIWRLSTSAEYADLLEILSKDESFYIADGHHRSAAASLYHKTVNSKDGKFLSFIIPDEELKILPFHRLMTLKEPKGKYGILGEIEKQFDIIESDSPVIPEEKGTIGLCLYKSWYELKFRGEREVLLDVQLLEKRILKPCFDVVDSRTDERLDYVAGNEDFQPNDYADHYDAVFTLYPVNFNSVKGIADENKTMPPKSTYILPKLRSGLLIQEV